jgi:putative methionine-R-sulfoxide reductase with GAF domain
MRRGIFFRLLGIVVLVGVLAIQGEAIKTRAFEGKTEHYTVVLKDGVDASAVADDHKGDGVKVEEMTTADGATAYVATMPAGIANDIRSDNRVSYIAMDGRQTVSYSWWETTMITLGLSTPHI